MWSKSFDIRPHCRRRQTVQSYLPGGTNLHSHEGMLVPPGKYDWICASFRPPESTSQMANRSVQPFFTAHGQVSSGMPGHVLSPNNWPFTWGIWAPYNTCFLEPTQVHNPNGISVRSAVHAQLTADSPYTLQWALPPKNCPFSWGIWAPI